VEKKKLFTENFYPGSRVYNEKLIKIRGKEYRYWNPYRSKLASAIMNGLDFSLGANSKVLYLGAATGTTVSHISDILKNGIVYSVENSPIAFKKLLNLCEERKNVIPIFEDAFHPDRYASILSPVDLVYQDISQRNQAEIFLKNVFRYLKNKKIGILMVKARSIDISLNPKKAYDQVCMELENNGLKICKKIDLLPYEKDHIAIVITH
jgi:fibrillarin-like pre-rRNA processing protein